MDNFKRIAKFELVSFEQFESGLDDNYKEESHAIYDSLKLPKRATKGSAGYDFYAPFDITLNPGETIKIPTGIRVKMEDNYVLKLYPRSGLGFKYRLQLNNTVGIIVELPSFKDKNYNILDFGAKSDIEFNNKKAIQEAIDTCSNNGGGIVIIPNGFYLTGPIELKSNVNLHLAKGAEIEFSGRAEDYLPAVFTSFTIY